MQPRGRFWGGSPGLQVQYFFQSPAGGRGLYWYRGKALVRASTRAEMSSFFSS